MKEAQQAAAPADGDMEMTDGQPAQKTQSKKQKGLSDLSAMGSALKGADKAAAKKDPQASKPKTISQAALDQDKERLEKISGLDAFNQDPLQNLVLHISNSVAAKQAATKTKHH